jgi:4-hydroxy 2-oxovalerate aldolase
MMSHMIEPERSRSRRKLMESYGAHCVYVTDSGGALDMDGVRARFEAYDRVLKPETQRGMHAHHNLSAGRRQLDRRGAECGAMRIDASLAGMGAGAGNAPLEVFIAAADRKGWNHGCDVIKLMDAAEDLVRPLAGPPGAGRPRNALSEPWLCRGLFQLPAPRGKGGAPITASIPARSWSNWAAARWSAGRKT